MEMYRAFMLSRQASEEFLTAHTLMEHHDKKGADFYHRYAMSSLDKLAETLGLELVARENVEGGR